MSARSRRFFWGNSLPQALMSAARYHGLPPEQLAYRQREKRHGFLRHPRRVVIEVDPQHPARATEAPVAPVPAAAAPRHTPRLRHAEPTRPQRAPATPLPAGEGGITAESLLPPDEESELAASEGLRRLLALAGLDLAVTIERESERLQIRLQGPDEAALQRLGSGFLDELEHLLPRTIKGLSGRLVRCRIDGAGLREGREDELRKLAHETAVEVLRSGEDAVLGPLSPADRRIIHLALAEDARLRTESFGSRPDKKLRVSLVTP